VKTESQPTAKHTQNPASDFKTPANQNSVKKDQGIKGEVVLQYANGNAGATSNSINPRFKIINNGTKAINLSDVKIRYYYTKEGAHLKTSGVIGAVPAIQMLQETSLIFLHRKKERTPVLKLVSEVGRNLDPGCHDPGCKIC